ncbi:protein F37C4.5 [Biomphalaria pfeifferi]|uniref:Protein F37C4.5 n=1 Tax=Biomphalaria pfeifferi TaxID=112525 RepID=A0AAD8C0U7_BIOPF|nr:protein F37C4.5 [Biomphalaria pfeifferi]
MFAQSYSYSLRLSSDGSVNKLLNLDTMTDKEDRTINNAISIKASECPVTKVTVYKDRAEVCRGINTTVKPGINELRIKEFVRIDEESIRVEGKGAATIAEVSFQSKYVTEDQATMSEKEKALNDQLRSLTEEKKAIDLANQKEILNRQWKVLDQFAATAAKSGQVEKKDEQVVFKLDDNYFKGMKEFMKEYKAIGKQLENERLDLERINEELDRKIEAVERNLNDLRGNYNTGHENRECIVVLDAEKEDKVYLVVSYVVMGASWIPSYDLRMFTEEGSLKISYYGLIYQNSGEDWNDVKLYLSTAEPSVGGTIPNLPMTQLAIRKPIITRPKSRSLSFRKSKKMQTSRAASPFNVNGYEYEQEDSFAPQMMMRGRPEMHVMEAEASKKLYEDDNNDEDRTCTFMANVFSNGDTMAAASMPVAVAEVCLLLFEIANKHVEFFWCMLGMRLRSSALALARRTMSPGAVGGAMLREAPEMMACSFSMDSAPRAAPMPEMAFRHVEVSESTTSTTYEIARQSTIPSDNTEHKVTVAIIELKPTLSYLSVPKVVPHAFLQAKVVNNSLYTLLPGRSNIFLDNSFVAKAEIKAVAPKEEFECSLGVDPSIRVDYKPLNKVSSQSGLISKSNTTTYEQNIEIKNLHNYAIKIVVRDNLPRSLDEKIKVTLLLPQIDNKHPEKNEKVKLTKSNHLEWDLDIKEMDKVDIVLKYAVEHPASEDIETTLAIGN